uniref:Uncharacterized protein n=1 Tax=Eutreptiella gymnastica TaxID=73025 RepID=A0A7S1IQ52_9EUGL|mmetsp:Transcript_34426/g.61667  ORF Transcript_34426/g.61667 Transcript_34426/m.61667 type:complete len:118 (+) Transcript_34426:216-569(+)
MRSHGRRLHPAQHSVIACAPLRTQRRPISALGLASYTKGNGRVTNRLGPAWGHCTVSTTPSGPLVSPLPLPAWSCGLHPEHTPVPLTPRSLVEEDQTTPNALCVVQPIQANWPCLQA